jgi:chemotaxis protein methyltransferase CheR
MPKIPSKKQLRRFLQRIENQLGLVFAETKYGRLQKHLTTRIKELECENVDDYLDILIDKRRQKDEFAWWSNVLTVGETFFYRNQAQWQALQQCVIPELMKRHQKDREMRFWSAGCATGEEPYTLAILLNEVISTLSSWQVDILATDVNPEFIKSAKKATYSKRSVRELSSEILRKYYDKKDNQYILREKIKKMVSFMTLNLVSDWQRSFDWQHGYFDVILCRNVIIYFNHERAQQVVIALSERLNDNGYLFLGHTESLFGMNLDFVVERFGNTFYYRKSREQEILSPESSSVILAPSMPKPAFPLLTPSMALQHANRRRIHLKHEFQLTTVPNSNGQIPSLQPTPETDKSGSVLPLGEKEILTKGKKLLQEDSFEEAERLLTAAAEEHPLSGNIHLLHGITSKTQGKMDEALRAFRRVLYLDTNNLLARFYLASLWQAQGTYERATTQYQMLLKQTQNLEQNAIVAGTEDLTVGLLRTACENALRQ